MDRPDWKKPNCDESRFLTLCPINAQTERRRHAKARQSPGVSAVRQPFSIDEKSALAQQYDMELHQMIGYMRRVDAAYGTNSKGHKSMDPFAADGEPKWAIFGKKTPLFGFWGYYAWEHVLGVVFSSSFGSIFTLTDQRSLAKLLAAEVMM